MYVCSNLQVAFEDYMFYMFLIDSWDLDGGGADGKRL